MNMEYHRSESCATGAIRALVVIFLIVLCRPVKAQEVSLDAMGDFRALQNSGLKSWQDGGLGKLTPGSANGKTGDDIALEQVVADIRVKVDSDYQLFTSVRAAPWQRTVFDFLEAYGKYEPVDSGALHYTVKIGAFFPPISLENEGVGWTSPWTLTPSAINSWVGEELRTVGFQGSVEWRLEDSSIELTGAVFGWNDPEGMLLSARGWSLNDRPVGIFDRVRMPDAFATASRKKIPLWEQPVTEIDNNPGYYVEASWSDVDLGKLTVLQYESNANPASLMNGTNGWKTEFTSVGAQTTIGNVTLLAQGMKGQTAVEPTAATWSNAYFESAYLLAGWDFAKEWTVAARIETYAMAERHLGTRADRSEHGNAITGALTWRPEKWLHLVAEAVETNYTRNQFIAIKLPAQETETQFQLSAKIIY